MTDPVKNTYKLSTVTKQDLKDYYSLWLRKGCKYPLTYLKATIGTCAGYFAPTKKLWVYDTNYSYEFSDAAGLVYLRNIIYSLFNWLVDHPFLGLFAYLCIYCWWIPLAGLYRSIKSNGIKGILPMMPVIITILTLIVSPYSFARYALPMVLTAPLVLFGYKKPDKTEMPHLEV